jgi:hypothetical protein
MFHIETNDDAPFGVALASVAGISDEAIDAAWRSDLITSATNRLQPPSEHVAQEMIDNPTTSVTHHALAATLRNSEMLHDLLVKHPDTGASAVENYFLTRESAQMIVDHDEDLASGSVALRLTADTVFPTALLQQEAESAASALLLSRLAVDAAQLFDSVADGTASAGATSVVDELVKLVVTGEDPNAGDHRRFRAALLELVGDDARQSLLFKISEEKSLLGTPSDWKHLIELIDDGLLFEDEIETRVDADSWLWAKLTGNAGYDAFSEFGRKSGTSSPRQEKDALKGRKAVQIDSTSDEAELMALLGYEEIAARTVLDSNASVSKEELESALDIADAETVIDWAEGRLPRRPLTGDVIEQMLRMGVDRVVELSVEVGNRPDPLKQNQELIIMTPGIAAAHIDPKSARALVEFLSARIADENWVVLLSLLADARDNDTVIQLLEAVNSLTV